MTRALVLIATFSAAAVVGTGCFIFTGSTDGYSPADAGSISIDDASCAPDATCLAFACVETSDCDAGLVCCFGSASGNVTSSCEVGPCQGPQVCKADTDCTDNGKPCTAQSCTVGQVTLTLQACGNIPGCAQ